MDIWPTRTFRPERQTWQLRGVLKSGGPSLSGLVQRVRSDGGGYWAVELADIRLRTADQIRLWRAWEALLDGGATPFIMLMCDARQQPTMLVNGQPLRPGSVPHSDGAMFSDATAYSAGVIAGRVVFHPDMMVPPEQTQAAALRATTISIEMTSGHQFRGGEHFSINHATKGHRLYRVRRVVGTYGTTQVVEIRPPLREAVTVYTPIDAEAPKCVMALADPDGMAATVEAHLRATETVVFVESF